MNNKINERYCLIFAENYGAHRILACSDCKKVNRLYSVTDCDLTQKSGSFSADGGRISGVYRTTWELPFFPAVAIFGKEKPDEPGIEKCFETLFDGNCTLDTERIVGLINRIAENVGCEVTVRTEKNDTVAPDAAYFAAYPQSIACLSAIAMLTADKNVDVKIVEGNTVSLNVAFNGRKDSDDRMARLDFIMRDSGIPFAVNRMRGSFKMFFCPYRRIAPSDGSMKADLPFDLFADKN